MRLFIIEGREGTTELVEKMIPFGIDVVSKYMDGPRVLDAQNCGLLFNRLLWIVKWMECVMQAHESGIELLVADTSPLFSYIYANAEHKLLIKNMVDSLLVELKQAGIEINVIYVEPTYRDSTLDQEFEKYKYDKVLKTGEGYFPV